MQSFQFFSISYLNPMHSEPFPPGAQEASNISFISDQQSDDQDLVPSEKRGRKRHGVWDHYTKVDNKAQCNYCEKVVRARPNETMKTHLCTCERALDAGVNLDEVFPDGNLTPSPTRMGDKHQQHDSIGGYVPIAVKPKGDQTVRKTTSKQQQQQQQQQHQQQQQQQQLQTQHHQQQQLLDPTGAVNGIQHSVPGYPANFGYTSSLSAVDYSVYLVTDSGLVPQGSTVAEHVRQAVNNGVTIVQLREKDADTRDFIEIAREVHSITMAAGVPLIINDRVDVALAIDAEGVHVGQDDMDVGSVRRFLNNPGKIIGLSVHDANELENAIKDGVDYVGIGAVFGTQTKELKKNPIGVQGLKSLLTINAGRVKTVAIGGINHSNVQRVLYSSTPYNSMWKLDGVAVVSCIMASVNPGMAAKSLSRLYRSKCPWESDKPPQITEQTTVMGLVSRVPLVIKQISQVRPLLHHITNNVVKNFSANVSLAVGASPAMSEAPQEFADFSSVPTAALLVNMGMPTPEGIDMYLAAIKEYNLRGRPVVFDPVGAGASSLRKNGCAKLLESSVFSVIKGNEGEIFAASGFTLPDSAKVQGVDSLGSAPFDLRVKAARSLAIQYRATVLMTGPQDIVVNETGRLVLVCDNGHKYMGAITGSGCSLGSIVSACVAVVPNDPFLATAAALAVYTLAGERAAMLETVQGPGTFVPAFIDALYEIAQECQHNKYNWIEEAKMKFL